MREWRSINHGRPKSFVCHGFVKFRIPKPIQEFRASLPLFEDL
jgi:hypothetical protein